MSEPIEFRPEANPVACWLIGGFIGLLGAGLIFTGFNRISYEPEWMIPQILLGVALCFLAWRAANYYRRPAFALTQDAIVLKPFWSFTKKIRYADMAGLGFYEQDNAAKDYSRRVTGVKTGQIVTSQHLVIRLKSNEVKEVVLPRYDNAELIDILQRKTGLKYEKMARQKAG
ncbi:MAG: hypothetical protein V3V04_03085 [Rhizobiaceae bacterium]